ncbi:MAG: D-alanyl-D-alanine carboxypeptidase [Clostridia bacterium]|nr:D-alanyl-D-alanine carboxypeptidase [Clostridia bacterium]
MGVYGVKTGFTSQAGRCLVTATKRGDLDIITIVLGADTKKIRTQDSAKLINYTFENFTLIDLKAKITEKYSYFKTYIESNIEIYKAKPEIKLETYLSNITYKKYPIKKDSTDSVSITLDSIDYLEAPVSKKTNIGKISVFIGNEYIFDCEILVKNTIERKDCFYYFKNFIKDYKLYF